MQELFGAGFSNMVEEGSEVLHLSALPSHLTTRATSSCTQKFAKLADLQNLQNVANKKMTSDSHWLRQILNWPSETADMVDIGMTLIGWVVGCGDGKYVDFWSWMKRDGWLGKWKQVKTSARQREQNTNTNTNTDTKYRLGR